MNDPDARVQHQALSAAHYILNHRTDSIALQEFMLQMIKSLLKNYLQISSVMIFERCQSVLCSSWSIEKDLTWEDFQPIMEDIPRYCSLGLLHWGFPWNFLWSLEPQKMKEIIVSQFQIAVETHNPVAISTCCSILSQISTNSPEQKMLAQPVLDILVKYLESGRCIDEMIDLISTIPAEELRKCRSPVLRQLYTRILERFTMRDGVGSTYAMRNFLGVAGQAFYDHRTICNVLLESESDYDHELMIKLVSDMNLQENSDLACATIERLLADKGLKSWQLYSIKERVSPIIEHVVDAASDPRELYPYLNGLFHLFSENFSVRSTSYYRISCMPIIR